MSKQKSTMSCPKCGTREGYVYDTYHMKDGTTKRVRICENGHRFYTLEQVREDYNKTNK